VQLMSIPLQAPLRPATGVLATSPIKRCMQVEWIPMGEPCLVTCDASLKQDSYIVETEYTVSVVGGSTDNVPCDVVARISPPIGKTWLEFDCAPAIPTAFPLLSRSGQVRSCAGTLQNGVSPLHGPSLQTTSVEGANLS